MNDKIRAAFLVLVLLQALHSVEELLLHFYEVFPPMALLYRDAPSWARPAFIVSNVVLVTAGLVCWRLWVVPGGRWARGVVWAWAGGEAFNVIAHCVWAVAARGYNPGLVTGLGFVPVVAYLIYLLRRAPTYAAA
jgi:F0F1-type ATP synthase assembly protein I